MTRNIRIKDGKIVKNEKYGINDDCDFCFIDDWGIAIIDKKVIVHNRLLNNGKPIIYKLADGVLNLFDDSSKHYSYFRNERLVNFMEEFRLDTINKCDPNIDYFMDTIVIDDLNNYYFFYTDGYVSVINDKNSYHHSASVQQLRVTDATFVYYKQVHSEKSGKRAISFRLFTNKDAFKLSENLRKCKRHMKYGKIGYFHLEGDFIE